MRIFIVAPVSGWRSQKRRRNDEVEQVGRRITEPSLSDRGHQAVGDQE